MCKKELLEKIKTKSSLVLIQTYVEEIVKEKYKGNLLNDEIFCLFESVVDLANDVYEDDKLSQETDLTSIYSALNSLCSKLGINMFEAWTTQNKNYLTKEYA